MATYISKPSSKPASRSSPTSKPSATATSAAPTTNPSLSSHAAMVELKGRILSSLSKLSDRDTHQIAIDDLEKIIRTIPPDGVPTLLHSLLHDPSAGATDSKPAPAVARREPLRLLALLCAAHPDAASSHLPKIVSHIARRLKDPSSDSSVRDACRDAAGSLAALYIRPSSGGDDAAGSPVVAMFVRPLLEAMGEQNKAVQAGAAACLAKIVESAGAAAGGAAFQKLCPRICKSLSGQSFLAKGALLSVVSSLAQIGTVTPQNIQPILQSIRDCLENSDWATRKAAADTLCVLASQPNHLIADGTAATIAALEASRFDKVKPVRDSMMEALSLWKKVAGKGEDGISEGSKDGKNNESADAEEKLDQKRSKSANKKPESLKDSSTASSPPAGDSATKEKGNSIPEKAAVILKKRAPSLTDKEFNIEFFQKLETRSSGDIEVVLPRRCIQSSNSQGEEEPESNDGDPRAPSSHNGNTYHESNESRRRGDFNYNNAEKRLGANNRSQDADDFSQDRWTEQRGLKAKDSKSRAFDIDDRNEFGQKDPSIARVNTSRTDGPVEGSFTNSKGNWLAIQRQLSQLERQQANIMNMLQDFMGGSHDSMITLENRVRGLERIVEEMARDLAVSSGRRGGNVMLGFEGSPGRSSSKFNGYHEYSSSKYGRAGDGRMPFAERFLSSDNMISGSRGRDPPWRSDAEAWDSYPYNAPRSGLVGSRRGIGASPVDGRLPRTERDSDQVGTRRAWDKGQGPFRLGEGPSARSIWQASKDEATLEAIRVAGEDNGTPRSASRGAIRELDAEAVENTGQDRGPLWALWTRAMDALHAGDVDSAYAEVLSAGDDLLLVKLMDKSGPVMDQLSSDIAGEMLRAVGQFLLEQSLFDMALTWIQQLTDMVIENGPEFLGISLEGKRQILLDLHEASAMEPPEDWDGPTPEQMMVHLASAWEINIQQLIK
ncbi:Armadillo-like helical-containing protein [Dioscorea alata]|uniref:Armadillo-like helical-containing protein n=1 Tax=Dioscorea alata TaxID=55571 RepID=A0ACB7VMX8_DIOAL|nr:Armadillo-like helical-containing protein [Dioscorea alata]